MPLEASDQNQITVILILATVLFIVASALPQKVATIALLILVPYQSIETRFGTSSVVLAFVIFIAFLLKGESVRLPMLPQILFLFLWYLISMSQEALAGLCVEDIRSSGPFLWRRNMTSKTGTGNLGTIRTSVVSLLSSSTTNRAGSGCISIAWACERFLTHWS